MTYNPDMNMLIKKHKASEKKALNNENNECWLFFKGLVSSLAAKVVTNDYRTEFEMLHIYNIFIFHLFEKLKKIVPS